MATQKYCTINGAAVNYSDADPVNIQRSSTAPDQCDFVLKVPYTTMLPQVGQHLEWFRRDGTRIFNGLISEIDRTGVYEGATWIAVPIKGVGYNDRLYHRTTFNRLTSVCAQYRSFSSTVDASDVSGTGHVYWVSGDRFAQVLAGKSVMVNGAAHTVATVVSPQEFTISGAFGASLPSVTFAYTVYSGDAVKDLLDNYASFEGFTYDALSIQNGAALDSKGVMFDPPITVQDAINSLLQSNPDFYFAVDVNQKCWFATRTLVASPGDFTTTSGRQKRAVQIRVTAADVRNVEISTVAWDAVDDSPLTITGDGASKSWFTAKPIASIVSATLNGVPVDVVDGSGTGTGSFYYFPNDNMVWQDPADPALSSADTLVITVKATAENLIEYADDAARVARQSIEGSGFGRYEESIDRTGYGRVAALAAATGSVNRLKSNYEELDLNTFELGYDVGQVTVLDIPKLQISGVTYFIDQATMNDSNCKGSKDAAKYDFEYTLRLVSVTRRLTDDDVLRSLFGFQGPQVGVSQSTGGGGSTGTTQTVTAASASDTHAYSQDATKQTYTDIQVTGTVTPDAGLQPVTIYLSKDNGVTFTWIGQYMHTGTSFTVDFNDGWAALVPAANTNCKVAVVAGAAAGVGGLPILAALLPVGAFISATFVVAGIPAASTGALATGMSITSGPTYMGLNVLGEPYWKMTIGGSIPANIAAGYDPNVYSLQVTVQGVDASGTPSTLGPNAGEREWFESDNIAGSTISSPTLLGRYEIRGSLFLYLRIRIYAVTRKATTIPGWKDATAVLLHCWSGGADHVDAFFGPTPARGLRLTETDVSTTVGMYLDVNGNLKIGTADYLTSLQNATFEDCTNGAAYNTSNPPPGWLASAASGISASNSSPYAGNLSLQLSNAPSIQVYQVFAATPVNKFYLEARVKQVGVTTGNLLLIINYYDKSGTYLGNDYNVIAPGSATGWTLLYINGTTPPPNTSKVAALISTDYAATGGGNWFVDNVVFRLQLATGGPLYTDVAGNVNLKIASDFVVSGGVLTQNAVDLAKAINFGSEFAVSGGAFAVNAIAVNKLLAGTALFAGDVIFARTGGGQVTINSAGMAMADNYTSPTITATMTATGFTLTRGSYVMSVTASGFSMSYGSAHIAFSSSGFVVLDASGHSTTIVGYSLTTGAVSTSGLVINAGLGLSSDGLQIDTSYNSTTATAGTATLPSNPDHFITIKQGGSTYKLAAYRV